MDHAHLYFFALSGLSISWNTGVIENLETLWADDALVGKLSLALLDWGVTPAVWNEVFALCKLIVANDTVSFAWLFLAVSLVESIDWYGWISIETDEIAYDVEFVGFHDENVNFWWNL